MLRVLVSLIALVLADSPFAAQAPSAGDEARVRAALQHYLYVTLLKDGDRWVIIGKSFDRDPQVAQIRA
jgi:hypothetical protein